MMILVRALRNLIVNMQSAELLAPELRPKGEKRITDSHKTDLEHLHVASYKWKALTNLWTLKWIFFLAVCSHKT